MNREMKDKIAKSMLSKYSSRLYDALEYIEDEDSRVKLDEALQSFRDIAANIEWQKD